jgi:HicB-like protein involved in pilus formation
VKQLLLRVDEALHARLAEQARSAGKSVNALANEILGLGIDPDKVSRRDRLHLKLMTIGEIRGTVQPSETLPAITPEQLRLMRERALESMRGAGPLADDLINHERDR